MGISTRHYQDIMNEYDAVRRRNYMAEQERKERVYALIPEIRQIDEQIAQGPNTWFITQPFKSSGTVVLRTTVTDSRGQKATLSKNISVTEWYSPTVKKPSRSATSK